VSRDSRNTIRAPPLTADGTSVAPCVLLSNVVKAIGVRELRQHASRYLAQVEAGEEIGVTNNGRLVARLVPVQAAVCSREALVDAGVLIPARRPQNLLEVTATPARGRKRNLSDVLSEMREER
jgi:prevent-host-death family protein